MAGPTAAETTKLSTGGSGSICDLAKQHIGKGQTVIGLTNTQIAQSGAGFWADMAKQGGQVVSP